MRDTMITDIEQLVEGEMYKFKFRSDYDADIKEKYKCYIYNGYKTLSNGAQYYEFMSEIKCYRKPVLAVFQNNNFYQYGSESNEHTSEYKFAAMGYINYKKGLLETYDIYKSSPEYDLYGYDEFCFNIYKLGL